MLEFAEGMEGNMGSRPQKRPVHHVTRMAIPEISRYWACTVIPRREFQKLRLVYPLQP